MANSWNEIDGVALNWNDPEPALLKYYCKALWEACQERCGYVANNALHPLTQPPIAWNDMLWAEPYSLRSFTDFIYNLETTILKPGFYWTGSGLRGFTWVPTNVSTENTGCATMEERCAYLGIDNIEFKTISPNTTYLKTFNPLLKNYKTFINSLKYALSATATTDQWSEPDWPWITHSVSANFSLTVKPFYPTDITIAWPNSIDYPMASQLTIRALSSLEVKDTKTGTSPILFTSIYADRLNVDISGTLNYED